MGFYGVVELGAFSLWNLAQIGYVSRWPSMPKTLVKMFDNPPSRIVLGYAESFKRIDTLLFLEIISLLQNTRKRFPQFINIMNAVICAKELSRRRKHGNLRFCRNQMN